MRQLRKALIGAMAATVMVGAMPAIAAAKSVWTDDEAGRAKYSVSVDGAEERARKTITVKACDEDKDGSGVVAFVLGGHRPHLTKLTGSVSRGGEGSCGEPHKVRVTAAKLWVKVCLHDKSKVKKPVSQPFDPNLDECRTKRV